MVNHRSQYGPRHDRTPPLCPEILQRIADLRACGTSKVAIRKDLGLGETVMDRYIVELEQSARARPVIESLDDRMALLPTIVRSTKPRQVCLEWGDRYPLSVIAATLELYGVTFSAIIVREQGETLAQLERRREQLARRIEETIATDRRTADWRRRRLMADGIAALRFMAPEARALVEGRVGV